MPRQTAHLRHSQGLSRRQLLQAGLAAGAIFSSWPLSDPLWGQEAGPPKRGGILRVRGYDPVHFDPQLTRNFKTNTTLSFVYSKLLRHKVGPDVRPGTFIVEPDLAERWEALDDTTYVFHLRKGVKWHNKPPVNGRDLVAEDVKFTFDRFLTEKGNPERQLLESVDRVEVVDRPHLRYQDFLANLIGTIWMRTDKPPFTDVRVRRAISHAIDRQAIIDAVYLTGEPSPAVPRGLTEWSLSIDQLGEGAKYYRYDPREARRLLAEAGYAKGFKTSVTATGGYGHDLLDAAQLILRQLKDVGIEAELKLQEYGAYMATTGQGKFEGLAVGPYAIGWEPDSSLYGPYLPDQPRNRSHVNDPKLTAMVKEQRRTTDLEARKKLIIDIQRYAAEQQYYVYLFSTTFTGSWQPYVKNYAPNLTFDFGSRAAVLWLDR